MESSQDQQRALDIEQDVLAHDNWVLEVSNKCKRELARRMPQLRTDPSTCHCTMCSLYLPCSFYGPEGTYCGGKYCDPTCFKCMTEEQKYNFILCATELIGAIEGYDT